MTHRGKITHDVGVVIPYLTFREVREILAGVELAVVVLAGEVLGLEHVLVGVLLAVVVTAGEVLGFEVVLAVKVVASRLAIDVDTARVADAGDVACDLVQARELVLALELSAVILGAVCVAVDLGVVGARAGPGVGLVAAARV